MTMFWLLHMNPLPWDLQNVVYYIRYEVLKNDVVVKMGSYVLNIWEDWLKEWDVMKSLAKIVKISEEFTMISYTY